MDDLFFSDSWLCCLEVCRGIRLQMWAADALIPLKEPSGASVDRKSHRCSIEWRSGEPEGRKTPQPPEKNCSMKGWPETGFGSLSGEASMVLSICRRHAAPPSKPKLYRSQRWLTGVREWRTAFIFIREGEPDGKVGELFNAANEAALHLEAFLAQSLSCGVDRQAWHQR